MISTNSVGFAYATDPVVDDPEQNEVIEEIMPEGEIEEELLDEIMPLNEDEGIEPLDTGDIYPTKEATQERFSQTNNGFKVADGKYLIEDADDLAHLSACMWYGIETSAFKDKQFIQTANIDISGYELWRPIGPGIANDGAVYSGNTVSNKDFQGKYDGQNHTISGMKIDVPKLYALRRSEIDNGISNGSGSILYVGLFGKVTTGGAKGQSGNSRLENINVVDANITFGQGTEFKAVQYGVVMVGGLIGRSEVAINNCSVIDSKIDGSNITAAYDNVATVRIGGIAGDAIAENFNFTNCKSIHNYIEFKNYATSGATNARAIVGGVVGIIRNAWGTLTGDSRLNNNIIAGNTIILTQANAQVYGGFIDEVVGVYSPGEKQETKATVLRYVNGSKVYTTNATTNNNYIFANTVEKRNIDYITEFDDTNGFNRLDAIKVDFNILKDLKADGTLETDKHIVEATYECNRNLSSITKADLSNFKVELENGAEISYSEFVNDKVTVPASMDTQNVNLVLNHEHEGNYLIKSIARVVEPLEPKLLLVTRENHFEAVIDHSSIVYTDEQITDATYHWIYTKADGTQATYETKNNVLDSADILTASNEKLQCWVEFTHSGYPGISLETSKTDMPILHSGKSFYVDSVNGSDDNNGLTDTTAFKTLEKAIAELPSYGDVDSNVIYIVGTYSTTTSAPYQVYGNRTEDTGGSQPSSQVVFPELLQGSMAPNDTMPYSYLAKQPHKSFTIAGFDNTSKLAISNITDSANTAIWMIENDKPVLKTLSDLSSYRITKLNPITTKSIVQMGNLKFDNIQLDASLGSNAIVQWYCNGYDLTITDSVNVTDNYKIGKSADIGTMSAIGNENYLYWTIYGGTLGTLPMVATLGEGKAGEYGIVETKPQKLDIQSGAFARIMAGGRIGDSQRNFYRYFDKKVNDWVYPYNENYIYTKDGETLSANNTSNYTAKQEVKAVSDKYLHQTDIFVGGKARVGLVVGGQTEDIYYGKSTITIDAQAATVAGGSVGNKQKLYNTTKNAFINGKYTTDIVKKTLGLFSGDFKGNTEVTVLENAEINYLTGGSLGRALYTKDDVYCAMRGENITINIEGGIIHESVYGAGAGGTAGTYTYNGQYNEDDTVSDLTKLEVTYPTEININISGGIVEGNVYGAGDGYFEYASYVNKHAGWLLGDTVVDITGGLVKGNIYGGGKGVDYEQALLVTKRETIAGNNDIAHVFGNTYVRVRAGEVKGNVYGAGQGVEYYLDKNSKSALANGSMGQVTGFSLVVLGDLDESREVHYEHNSYIIDGNVFGGGQRGNVTSGYNLPGNTAVVMAGGRIYKSVYGGGENADVITPAAIGAVSSYKQADLGSLVFVAGGEINQAIFGGCKSANVQGNAKVVILGGTIVGDVFGGNDEKGNANNTLVYISSRGNFTHLQSVVFGGGYGIETDVLGDAVVRIGDRTLDGGDETRKINFDSYSDLSEETFNNIYNYASNQYAGRGEKEITAWSYLNYLAYDMYKYEVKASEDKAVQEAALLLEKYDKYDGNKIVISNRIYGGGMLGRANNSTVIMYGGTLVASQYDWREDRTRGYTYVGRGNGNYIMIADDEYEYKEGGDYIRDPLYIDYVAIFGGGFGLDVNNLDETYEGLYPANVDKSKVILADTYGIHITDSRDNTIDDLNQDDALIFGGGQLATVGLSNELIKSKMDVLKGTNATAKKSAMKEIEAKLSKCISDDNPSSEVLIKDSAHPTNNVYGAGQGRANGDFAKVYGHTKVETYDYSHITKHEIYNAEKDGISIFGGGQNAGVNGTTKVIISGNTVADRVYGGNQYNGAITGSTYTYSANNYGVLKNDQAQYSTSVYIVERASVNEAFGGGYEASMDGHTLVYVNGDSVGSWKGNGIDGDPHKEDSKFYKYWKAVNDLLKKTPELANKTYETRDLFESIPLFASYGIYGYKVKEKITSDNDALLNVFKKSNPALAHFGMNAMLEEAEKNPDLANPALNLDKDGVAHAPTANVYDLYGGGYISDVGDTTVIIRGGAVFNVYGAGAGKNATATTNAEAANVKGTKVAILPGSTVENVYGGANTNGTAVTSSVIVGNIPDYVKQGGDIYNHLGKKITDVQSIEFKVDNSGQAGDINGGKEIAGKTFEEATVTYKNDQNKEVTINKAKVVVSLDHKVTCYLSGTDTTIDNVVKVKTCDADETYIGTERIHIYGDVFGAGYGVNTKIIGTNKAKGDLMDRGTTVLINMPVESDTFAVSWEDREYFLNDDGSLIDFAGDVETINLDFVTEDGNLKATDSKLFNKSFSDSTVYLESTQLTTKVLIDVDGIISFDPVLNTDTDIANIKISIRKTDDIEHDKIQEVLYGSRTKFKGTTFTKPVGNVKADLIVVELPTSEGNTKTGQVAQHIIWRDASSEYNSNRIDGSVYGGGDLGQVGSADKPAKTNVIIKDGHISGSVFGGGSGKTNGVRETRMGAVYGYCETLVEEGYIEGNVYGAGDQSMTYGGAITTDGVVSLTASTSNGSTPKESAQLATNVTLKELETTSSNGGSIVVGGSVFGGGNAVENSNYATITSVFGATKVDIIGRQQVKYENNEWQLNDLNYIYSTAIYLQGGVYGDGHLCLVHGNREVNINYYHYSWHDFDLLKTFYSIQRADTVNMVGSRIILRGDKDLVDVNGTGTLYSINRVGTLNLKHNSTVKLSTIVNYLGGLTSDTEDGAGGNQQTRYIYKGNNGKNENGVNNIFLNEADENSGYTGAGGTIGNLYQYRVNNINQDGEAYKAAYHDQYFVFKHANKDAGTADYSQFDFNSFNVVCVANGKYLEIRKEDGAYGKVEGLFTLELLRATPGEGGGFVYANLLDSTGDFICNTMASIAPPSEREDQGTVPETQNLLLANNTGNEESIVQPESKDYMDVEDNVGGYRNDNYTYYYWYILGSDYHYDVEMEGYIGSPVTSYPVDTGMFVFSEGYTYSLMSLDGKNSIAKEPSSSQFDSDNFTDSLTDGVIADDKYAIEIKASYTLNKSNETITKSLGFLSYNGSKWGVRVPIEYESSKYEYRLNGDAHQLIVTSKVQERQQAVISGATVTVEGTKVSITVNNKPYQFASGRNFKIVVSNADKLGNLTWDGTNLTTDDEENAIYRNVTISISWEGYKTMVYDGVTVMPSKDNPSSSGVIYGFGEGGLKSETSINNNALFIAPADVKALDIVYVLHKGKNVTDELDNVPVSVTMMGFEKNKDGYSHAKDFTYAFDTLTSITLLVPEQNVNVTYGKVYENFEGLSNEAVLNITKDSAITAQFITSYRPVAYGTMQRVLTLSDSHKIYLHKPEDGLSVTVAGDPVDGRYKVIYSSDKQSDKYYVKLDSDDKYKLYTTENDQEQCTLLKDAEDVASNLKFPKGTTITLVSKILDFDETYWTYSFTKAEPHMEASKLKKIDNSDSNVSFTLANACNNGEVEGVYINDGYHLGVIENMIFVIDFSNVTEADWAEIGGPETDDYMRLKFAHLYVPTGDATTPEQFNSKAIDIMNYVKKTKNTNGEISYTRRIPLKTNQFVVNKTSDGINSFALTIDESNTTANRISGTVNFAETRSENINSPVYNTHAYSDYDGREYAVKLELYLVDDNDVVSNSQERLTAGTTYLCDGREYEVKNDQTFINVPLGQTDANTTALSRGFEIDLYRDLLTRNINGKYQLKATLYSSFDGEYLAESDAFASKYATSNFTVTADMTFKLALEDTDGNSVYNKGDNFSFSIKTYHTDGNISNDSVSYALYKYQPNRVNQYLPIDITTILYNNGASLPEAVTGNELNVNHKISATAPKGTYRLAVHYHDRVEYMDFIVK